MNIRFYCEIFSFGPRSAPEILLSVVEIIAKNFKAGDLGPGTIVGSAAVGATGFLYGTQMVGRK